MVLMLLTVGFDDFDRWFWWFWCFDSRFWWFWCFDSRFWCFWWFWQLVLMVLMFWQQVLMFLMILTGGFCFWRLYNKWQKVLMFLMILTGGFDGFDVFDSRFWWFWQEVFVFEGCIINDRRFWCFWWFWQVVLMVLMFLTAGFDDFDRRFCFWRLYFKSCYTHRRFCPLKTLLSGNSPPTHSVYKWVSVFYINQKEKTWATWAWTVYRPLNPQRRGWAAERRTVYGQSDYGTEKTFRSRPFDKLSPWTFGMD